MPWSRPSCCAGTGADEPMTRRRRGRPYQPYPARTTNWGARLVIVVIGFIMVIGIAVLAFSQ